MSFTVTFRGVRGSLPTPVEECKRYGGNTSCIEVRCGAEIILFDSGTGIRKSGIDLLKNKERRVNLFLSHTHWDHIHALPFFQPGFHPEWDIIVRAGHLKDHGGIAKALHDQMRPPFFPIPMTFQKGLRDVSDFRAGDHFKINGEVKVKTATLNHPNGATGYRIEYKNKAMCYVTDTEHVIGQPDQNVLGLIQGADLVIYDSTYTDEKFSTHIGWGHSTWQEGIRLCKAAQAKSLAIFHHDPDHNDAFMDKIAERAKQEWNKAFVAQEDHTITILR